MALQCVACEMHNGRVITYLPGIVPSWPLRRTISTYDTAEATLLLDASTPANWQRAVLEGGAWLAWYDDEDLTRAIQWCGYVVNGAEDLTDTSALSLSTAEGYMNSRYVGDETHTTGEGRDDIIAQMIDQYVLDGIVPGIPITVAVDAASTNPHPVEDLVWQNTDNASVLTRMTQLFAQLGGEFTVDWDWTILPDGATALAATLRIGDRIGTPVRAGYAPAVTFSAPGPITALKRVRDYSTGKGANSVTAYSSGQGSDTPYAAPVVAPDFGGRTTFEYRYQPAPSISPDALAQYAQQAIKVLAPGAQTVTLTAALNRLAGRRFGRDWRLGDDIGFRVEPYDELGQPIRAFPGGLSGVGRVIAVDVTDRTISPIFADTSVYVEGS